MSWWIEIGWRMAALALGVYLTWCEVSGTYEYLIEDQGAFNYMVKAGVGITIGSAFRCLRGWPGAPAPRPTKARDRCPKARRSPRPPMRRSRRPARMPRAATRPRPLEKRLPWLAPPSFSQGELKCFDLHAAAGLLVSASLRI